MPRDHDERTPHRQVEIESMLDKQHGLSKEVEDVVDRLESRLSKVMREDKEEKKSQGVSGSSEPQTEVGNRMDEICLSLRRSLDRLLSIEKCLEL